MFFILCFYSFLNIAATLPETIKKVKPAVVGIGLHTPLGQPKNIPRGSGFVVADGFHVITNDHVLPLILDEELNQKVVVFIGSGRAVEVRFAEIIDRSREHDLAILKISGRKLPTLKLAEKSYLAEGESIAFTGFPIGNVLGLYPVTHRGIISALTPDVIPASDAKNISIQMLKRLRDPRMVYQLDAVAYPGNSGSALYQAKNGKVVGVINKVFVQATKEAVLSNPSGITYAIPVRYVHELLEKNNIKL